MSDDRPSEPSKLSQATSIITSVKPGLYIVKFWQGIVDIIIRAVVAVGGLIVLASGASFSGDGFLINDPNARGSAGGWLAFVGFMIMAIELVIIALRFVNFQFVVEFSFLVMIVNIIYCAVACAALFAGFVPIAVYADQFSAIARFSDSGSASIVLGLSIKAGVAAAFAFLLIAALIGELVYACLWNFLKWYKRLSGSYDVSSPEKE